MRISIICTAMLALLRGVTLVQLGNDVILVDVIRNPEKELKRLMAFLGLDFDRKMMKIDLSEGHIGRWKKELGKEDLTIVEKHLGRYLERYGYYQT